MVTSFIWGLTVITLFRRMKDYCSVTATHFSCSAALIHTSVVKNCQIPLNTEHMQAGSICCLLLKTTDTSIYLSSTLISFWCSLHWRMNNVLKNQSVMKQIIWLCCDVIKYNCWSRKKMEHFDLYFCWCVAVADVDVDVFCLWKTFIDLSVFSCHADWSWRRVVLFISLRSSWMRRCCVSEISELIWTDTNWDLCCHPH